MKLRTSIIVICLALLCGARSHAHSFSAPRAPKPQMVAHWLWMPAGVTNGLTGSNFVTANFTNASAYVSVFRNGTESWSFLTSASANPSNFNSGNRLSFTNTPVKVPWWNVNVGGTLLDLSTNSLALRYTHQTNADIFTDEYVQANLAVRYANLSCGFLFRTGVDGTGGDTTAIDLVILAGTGGHSGSLNVHPSLSGTTNMYGQAESGLGSGGAITNFLPNHTYWGTGVLTNGGTAWQVMDAENGYTNLLCNNGTPVSFRAGSGGDTATAIQFGMQIGHPAVAYAAISYLYFLVLNTNANAGFLKPPGL